MDVAEWLGQWEPIEAPGRHCRRYPAPDGQFYQYRPGWTDRRPRVPEMPYSMRERVNRAIPMEGTVREPAPSWAMSPQVRFWLEKEKTPILERIRAWLKKPVQQ